LNAHCTQCFALILLHTHFSTWPQYVSHKYKSQTVLQVPGNMIAVECTGTGLGLDSAKSAYLTGATALSPSEHKTSLLPRRLFASGYSGYTSIDKHWTLLCRRLLRRSYTLSSCTKNWIRDKNSL